MSPHGSRPHGHDRSLALCVNNRRSDTHGDVTLAYKLLTNPLVPHGSRPHGHDRSLMLCVFDPACWQSTPVLQSTRWPDEDLSLWGRRHITTRPASNSKLSTSGVLQVHRGVLLVHWCRHSWRRFERTAIGILPRETLPTLHGIGEHRDREVPMDSGFRFCLTNSQILYFVPFFCFHVLYNSVPT